MTTPSNPDIDKANRSVAAASVRAEADLTRPGYHFRPPALWMNDPNAPIFHNGWFHLFYQHNPYGDDWGHMHWGHTRSRDLVHWEHLPIALWPSLEQGEEHVFSGCAWKDGSGQPLLFYTSVKVGEQENRPVNEQWAAQPLDPDLILWEKHPANPILALHHAGAPSFNGPWRDPFIFEEAGRTFLVIGGDFENSTGVALYEALDDSLLRWHYHGLLVETSKDNLRFYECPNFVKIGNKWILLTSPYKPIEYRVGDFDLKTLKFTVEQEGVLDPGMSDVPNFYASNIVFDAHGRCILLGWLRGFAKGRGWNGALALPRILTIDADGRPRQQPLPELVQLRGEHHALADMQVWEGEGINLPLSRAQVEVSVQLMFSAPGVFTLSLAGKPLVEIRSGVLSVLDTTVALEAITMEMLDLHVFIDNSVIEVFADGGRVAVTRIIDVPTGPSTVEFAVTSGSVRVERLDVWEIGSIWTPAA